MELTDIITSFATSEKLHKAGIIKDSIFSRYKKGEREGIAGGHLITTADMKDEFYRAYTTDELLPMFPPKLYGHLFESDLQNADDIGYGQPYRTSCYDDAGNKKKNPEILAEMLLELISTGAIKVEEKYED